MKFKNVEVFLNLTFTYYLVPFYSRNKRLPNGNYLYNLWFYDKVWCCDDYLNKDELLEVFVIYSPKNFYELKLCYYSFDIESELLFPKELESFFISWSDRIVPQKSIF